MTNPSAAAGTTALLLLLLVASTMAAPQPYYFPLPIGPITGSVLSCWRAISSFEERCNPKVVVPQPITGRPKLSTECCETVEEMAEKCNPSNFPPNFPYSPKLLSLLKRFCPDLSPAAPAPQPAASA